MSEAKESLPRIYLVRHGETEWSIAHRHTGFTDLPLTPRGEDNARDLSSRLGGIKFDLVLTSPRQRARRTCELAGFGKVAVVDFDLAEWNYGEYEGRTSSEIRKEHRGWNLFRDGCPGGENAQQVGARADRAIGRIRKGQGNALVFSHRHFLSVFAVRWVGLPASDGGIFFLSEASVSVLGYDHSREERVVQLWNGTRHSN